jgi:hypothetical protein
MLKQIFLISILFLGCAEKRTVQLENAGRFGIVSFSENTRGLNITPQGGDGLLIFFVLLMIIYGIAYVSNIDTDPSEFEKLLLSKDKEELKKYLFEIDKKLKEKYPNYVSIEDLKIDETLNERMSLREKTKYFIEKNNLNYGIDFTILDEDIYFHILDENGSWITEKQKFDFNISF